MARRILIGRRNFAAHRLATFSGGNWVHPLTNLKEINPQYVAESIDNNPANTTFDIDLGAQRTVSVFHFSNLRISVNGLIRLRAGIDPTFTTNTFTTGTGPLGPESYLELAEGGLIELAEGGSIVLAESGTGNGWIPAWPTDSTPFDYNQWGEFSATGSYSSDEYIALTLHRFFVPPVPIPVRYIRFECQDTTGTVVQIGVFGAWEVWEPPLNIRYGRSISIVDESEIQTIPGGAVQIYRRGVRQRHSFGFGEMRETEVWLRSFGLTLMKGRSSPTVIVYNPEDTTNLEKQSIYGLFSTELELTNPFFGVWSHAFQVDQLI